MSRPEKCFACDRSLSATTQRLVNTRDDQTVYVGPDCYAKVLAAGDAGYQPPKGGPRLYPLPENAK